MLGVAVMLLHCAVVKSWPAVPSVTEYAHIPIKIGWMQVRKKQQWNWDVPLTRGVTEGLGFVYVLSNWEESFGLKPLYSGMKSNGLVV